jgi:RimJ/RimL family protein N-acetyltransferase
MIRPIEPRDARAILALFRTLDSETKFMLFEPDERTTSEAEQRERISAILGGTKQLLLVADEHEQLVGFLGATRGAARRNLHSASFVMGVRASHAGRGIGSGLLDELEAWARRSAIHRLELTVVAENERAQRLYRKHGFELEGRKRHALRVDGTWVDELAMGKLLGAE